MHERLKLLSYTRTFSFVATLHLAREVERQLQIHGFYAEDPLIPCNVLHGVHVASSFQPDFSQAETSGKTLNKKAMAECL